MRRITLLIIFLTYILAIRASRSTTSDIYRLYQGYTSEQLVKMGLDYTENRNMPDSAVLCFTLVISRYSLNDNKREKSITVEAYCGLWNVYYLYYFNYSKANEYLIAANNLCEEEGLNKCKVNLLFGYLYQTVSEEVKDHKLYKEALSHYIMAFKEAAKIHNDKVLQYSFANIANISYELGRMKDVDYYYKVYTRSRMQGDIYRFNILLYKFLDSLAKGHTKLATLYSDSLLALFPFNASKTTARYRYIALYNKMRLAKYQRHWEEALSWMKKAETLAISCGLKDMQLEVYETLADIYGKCRKTDAESHYTKAYYQLKDTLTNYRQLTSVNEMHFIGDMERIKQEMDRMRQRHNIQLIIIVAITILAIPILIMLFLLMRKNKRLQSSYRKLYEKSIEILSAEEKEKQQRHELFNHKGEKTSKKYSNSPLDSQTKEGLYKRVLNFMDNTEEIYERDFSLEALSSQLHVNYKYISQVINELSGRSFSTLLREYRIREACRRLNNFERYGNITIEGIAHSVGFKSRTAFISTFKRMTGLTPSEYQRMAKKPISDK